MRGPGAPRSGRKGKGSVLKRLKRSFIATTMTLVGVVMLAMIFMSYMNAQVSLDTLVSRSLDRALEASGATSAASNTH